MHRVTPRLINSLVLAGCCGLLLWAYYLEVSLGIVPCPLCWLQRIVFFALLFLLLAAVIHAPGKRGAQIYAVIALCVSVLGILFASRQVYLQSQPLDPHTPCVPGLVYLFKTLPFSQAATLMLKGSAACGQVHWSFLGLSMAVWSLLVFIVIALLMFLQLSGRVIRYE